MVIRDAIETDFAEITAIYNEILLNSTAIYSDQPAETAHRISLWQSRLRQNYPTLVACDAAVGRVVGFASFGDFRSWPGYRFTVEHTVHVHASSRGQGTGSALLTALIRRAEDLGKHAMIGGIDADNAASLHFHETHGFKRAAHLREVGYKFGRYLDLVLVERLLGSQSA